MKEVTAESITLTTESGFWLGQIVLTSDGAFMAITDYGNFNFAWRSCKTIEDMKELILNIDTDYFATKMATGMQYVSYGKKIDSAAERFALKILPALQETLRAELC